MNSIVQDLVAINSVEIGGEEVHTVNARDLHRFLGSKQRFADWIKSRINDFKFELGIDYLIHKVMKNPDCSPPHRWLRKPLSLFL